MPGLSTRAGDLLVWGALAISFPVAIVTRSPGCELGALPWLLAGRQGGAAPRPGCAVGLDRLDAWEASRRKGREGKGTNDPGQGARNWTLGLTNLKARRGAPSQAAELLRLFADHVGAAEFEPLSTHRSAAGRSRGLARAAPTPSSRP